MKTTCLLLLAGLYAGTAPAQTAVAPPLGLALKATASSLLDRFATILPLGLELDIKKRVGIGMNWALPLGAQSLINKTSATLSAVTYRKADMYLRYYFVPAAQHRFFIGAEYFYKEQAAFMDYVSYSNQYRESFRSTNADVRKFVSGAGMYFGRNYHFCQGHLVLEWYLGIGRKTVNNHIYTDNRTSMGGKSMGMFPDEDAYDDRSSALIYIPAGLCIGYRF